LSVISASRFQAELSAMAAVMIRSAVEWYRSAIGVCAGKVDTQRVEQISPALTRSFFIGVS
jgi:hypothetical protein